MSRRKCNATDSPSSISSDEVKHKVWNVLTHNTILILYLLRIYYERKQKLHTWICVFAVRRKIPHNLHIFYFVYEKEKNRWENMPYMLVELKLLADRKKMMEIKQIKLSSIEIEFSWSIITRDMYNASTSHATNTG